MNFKNKTILLTGASTGIGKALAISLAKIDCNLILIARRVELIKEYIDSLSEEPKAKILQLKCDVSKKDQVGSAYSQIIKKFGKIDVAILNAGFSVRMSVKDYNSEAAEQIFGANVFGIIYWVEQLIPGFIKRKEGMLVGVSSLADSKGYSKSGFYSASKAATSIYLEGLRTELRKFNVKVLTVRPGFVRTPMTDKNEFKMPLLMEPDKAVRIILKGIEKEKRIIQFPWQLVWATKLVRLVPDWIIERLESKVMKRYE